MAAGHFVLGDFTLFVVWELCWCSCFGLTTGVLHIAAIGRFGL